MILTGCSYPEAMPRIGGGIEPCLVKGLPQGCHVRGQQGADPASEENQRCRDCKPYGYEHYDQRTASSSGSFCEHWCTRDSVDVSVS
jgi:hypothetical protein